MDFKEPDAITSTRLPQGQEIEKASHFTHKRIFVPTPCIVVLREIFGMYQWVCSDLPWFQSERGCHITSGRLTYYATNYVRLMNTEIVSVSSKAALLQD